jgi:predicted GIY-YIG superfamily endonuclease
MTSERHGAICTGVTARLERRAFQRRDGTSSDFAERYGFTMLVRRER